MDRFMQQTLRQALHDLLFFKISNFLPEVHGLVVLSKDYKIVGYEETTYPESVWE